MKVNKEQRIAPILAEENMSLSDIVELLDHESIKSTSKFILGSNAKGLKLYNDLYRLMEGVDYSGSIQNTARENVAAW